MELLSGRGVWDAIAFTAGITIGLGSLSPVADGVEGWATSGNLLRRNGA